LIDTLKLARKLEDARFSREQAEAVAEAFADATTGTLASNADLELSTKTLGSELQASSDALRAELKTTADALRAELKMTADALRAELRTTADALRAELKTTADALRAELRALEATLREAMAAFHWRVVAAVAAMLLVHLMAVWGIIAANVPQRLGPTFMVAVWVSTSSPEFSVDWGQMIAAGVLALIPAASSSASSSTI
jgi:hypothetical protein